MSKGLLFVLSKAHGAQDCGNQCLHTGFIRGLMVLTTKPRASRILELWLGILGRLTDLEIGVYRF